MDLSIIVPIYNVEEYLAECLKSLYKISNLRYEVILVMMVPKIIVIK